MPTITLDRSSIGYFSVTAPVPNLSEPGQSQGEEGHTLLILFHRLNSYWSRQPPRGLIPTPKIVIEPDPEQAMANQSAIDLLRSWREGNPEEQIKTWSYLQHALEEDRLSNRPFFP